MDIHELIQDQNNHLRQSIMVDNGLMSEQDRDIEAIRQGLEAAMDDEDEERRLHRLIENSVFLLFQGKYHDLINLMLTYKAPNCTLYVAPMYDGCRTVLSAIADEEADTLVSMPEKPEFTSVAAIANKTFINRVKKLIEERVYPDLEQLYTPLMIKDGRMAVLSLHYIRNRGINIDYAILPTSLFDMDFRVYITPKGDNY